MTSLAGQLTTIESICRFAFAGKAPLTLRSRKTGTRFTYRITESKDGQRHYVALLAGADNEGDYQYLGTFHGGHYAHGRKSAITPFAPSARAFAYFAENLQRSILPTDLEVWHEGKCAHCGRKLTVPTSISTGFGPDCAEKLGIPMVECEAVPAPTAPTRLPAPLPEPLAFDDAKARAWNDKLSTILEAAAHDAVKPLERYKAKIAATHRLR